MRPTFLIYSALVVLALFSFFLGCEKTFIGPAEQNKAPEVWLSSGPVEGDTTGYQVHFYWGGWDPDGEVAKYEFDVVDGDPYGFDPQDTTGLDKWLTTTVHDSVFRVSTSDTFRKVIIDGDLYTRYDKTHTFFIRAVDVEGKRSEAVYRSFTAWTLSPIVTITVPVAPKNPEINLQSLGKVVNFQWKGVDPIDSPDNTQDPDSIRYLYHRVDSPGFGYYAKFNITNDLNKNPWRYDEDWSPWIYYRADGDSGRSTMLGDDETLELAKQFIFAVQAKDDAGAVTSIFSRSSNVRQFLVGARVAPVLTITEPRVGGFQFKGTNLTALPRYLPPGVELHFEWSATAKDYGGLISCYQYGWDVADLTNPDDWESDCGINNTECTATWYSGQHTLFVRVYDNSGTETLGQIEINIVPFTMDRNLLWVDDYPSDNSITQTTYYYPREDEHDALWLGHCARAGGFDPDRDVYDAKANTYNPPNVKIIGRYKNIIWSYTNTTSGGCLDNIIEFTPESSLGTGSQVAVNYLSIFLAKGGHLLTEGQASGDHGGLAASIPNAKFPMNFKCEMAEIQEGCSGDTSGVNSMPYKDYCITVIDKVKGMFRDSDDMPYRRVVKYDVMFPCMLKTNDAWNDSVPGMPDSLTLWSQCTKTGSFYARTGALGGFDHLEIYDPAYWMTITGTSSQGCFHPVYRMKTFNSLSCLNYQAVALWVTKYADVVPDVESGIKVAAPSLHLGFELWYFNRTQGTRIINTLFREWQILATE
jgi:hypothetical protein